MTEKLAISPSEAALALDVSRPTIYELMNRAESPIPNFRIGTRRLIPVEGLRAWVAAQAAAGGETV